MFEPWLHWLESNAHGLSLCFAVGYHVYASNFRSSWNHIHKWRCPSEVKFKGKFARFTFLCTDRSHWCHTRNLVRYRIFRVSCFVYKSDPFRYNLYHKRLFSILTFFSKQNQFSHTWTLSKPKSVLFTGSRKMSALCQYAFHTLMAAPRISSLGVIFWCGWSMSILNCIFRGNQDW